MGKRTRGGGERERVVEEGGWESEKGRGGGLPVIDEGGEGNMDERPECRVGVGS